jgi:hypothetical protein
VEISLSTKLGTFTVNLAEKGDCFIAYVRGNNIRINGIVGYNVYTELHRLVANGSDTWVIKLGTTHMYRLDRKRFSLNALAKLKSTLMEDWKNTVTQKMLDDATAERCNHDIQELENTISDLKEQLENKKAELTKRKP